MLKYIFFIELLIVVLLSGCNNNQTGGNVPVIDLEDAFDNNSQFVHLSKYAQELDYVPLETNSESVLDMGPKPEMKSDGKNIIIYNESGKSLNFYDIETGRFIKKLDKLGRGPGEYTSISSWDTKGDLQSDDFRIAVLTHSKILVYDNRDSCVCVYNYASGEDITAPSVLRVFLGPQDGFMYTVDISRRYNKDVAWYDKLDYLVYRDSLGREVSRSLIAVRDAQSFFKEFPQFFSYGGDLKFTNSTRDTIYRFNSQEGLSMDFLINYGKYEYIKKMTVGKAGRENFFNPDILGAFETGTFIVLAGCLPEKELPQVFTKNNYHPFCTSYILYDKKEKRTFALKKHSDYDYIGFIDDINGGMPFKPRYVQDNKMYQFIEAYDFIELAEQHNVPRMKEIAATLTEESNPVMVVATLK